MAISDSTLQAEQLDPGMTRLAAVASAVASLLGAAGLVAYLWINGGQAPAVLACQIGWIAVCGVLLTVSLQLLRKSPWAQRFLLGFWTVAAVVAALAEDARKG